MDILPIIIVLNAIFILAAMYAERANPQMLVLWMVLMGTLPLIGFILYLMFGQTFYSRYAFKRKRDDDAKSMIDPDKVRKFGLDPRSDGVSQALERSGASQCLGGNDVRYVSESEDFFDSLFEAMEKAEHHLFLEYYILRKDATGRRILEILIEKAKAGVMVRLLVD